MEALLLMRQAHTLQAIDACKAITRTWVLPKEPAPEGANPCQVSPLLLGVIQKSDALEKPWKNYVVARFCDEYQRVEAINWISVDIMRCSKSMLQCEP
ncbi:MAG: hypothetical protein KI785_14535 [Devosiaceae bacterium]|nr:hypothetical protein [Devosiaceae bacterium MH13]